MEREIITEDGDIKVGKIYRITGGWYKGEFYRVEFISNYTSNRMTSGILITNKKPINVLLQHLSTKLKPEPDRETLLRQTAQKLLKAGNKKAALKLLQTLKKKQ